MVAVVSEGSDTRDRVIALEVKMQHVTEQLDDAINKLNDMHDVMMQAKGVKWFILGTAGFFGFLSGLAAWLVPPFFQR